ncbi:MAG: B12-binding domain-containing radical SAM protein [Bacteroidetes bacterium]|nr:B12-binding domain-containing radical SAM protein [Bacteroidota bacterium]
MNIKKWRSNYCNSYLIKELKMGCFGLIYLNDSSFQYSQINIGITSICTFLQKNGHEVFLFDTFYQTEEEIVKACTRLCLDLVGFSTTEIHSEKAFRIAKEIQSHQKSKIIFGGPFPTIFPHDILSKEYIDYVCVGDGEYPLNDFLNGKSPLAIKGILGKNTARQNGVSKPFDINEIQVLDYSFFNRNSIVTSRKFGSVQKKIAFSWSSRGCSFSCAYCSNNELKQTLKYGVRYRNIDFLLKEINELKEGYNCKGIFLSDENFLFNKKHCCQFAEKYLHKKVGIPFGFLTRPEHICRKNIERLKLLRKSGWTWVSIGIEIGNQEKRKEYLNRNNTNNEIEIAFHICKELGVHTNAFLITGFDFDDVNDLLLTEQLLKTCKPDSVESSIIFPLKGTRLYQHYNKNNLLLKNKKTQSTKSYFEDIVIRHPIFSESKLLKIKKYWEQLPKEQYRDDTTILEVLN